MATRAVKKADDSSKGSGSRTAVIPVIQEQATAYKRVVETGKVRISKHVREYEELVDIPHFQEEVKVERVPVNQFVETAPSVRTEGDVTIIPILEEKYVLEKKLVLVEELHIRKERSESHQPQKVKVLKEEVEVNRIGPRGSTDASAKPNRGRDRDLRR
ncbi:MAG TPA: YsnF/AvaK domain-containing protein [Pyrinomonadaceae bacterium]|nr:YsnF/AvaK domain-containing protein [Pyrinomonadaceae bacterium]